MRYLLILCMVAGVAATAATARAGEGEDALQAFYRSVDTLRADFEQVQVDETGEAIQRTAGEFLLARPDRFRWSYREPYEQIIVSDGNAFYFHDVDLSQVTVRDVDRSLRATPAQLLAGGKALESAFRIEEAGRRDGLAWVTLTPREGDGDFTEIRIGFDDSRPARMELDDQLGQTTRIRFADVAVDVEIDPARFQLVIPDDATVVDGREQRP
ncbi:outer membrane lipoprotein chaperone LolA [Spectribacter hydrogenoxidans]|uniref:Outer-membrane lipoprotein carrier protein n=1 Tax=Spectribacter hydrogenoxidans TaxID=3075608 RepID=A0ABU3C3P0_9GAMM|nr:outer membrane lipoprotein chaperone LolA [Salinisphaera sp. W335]MDT0636173.1 outer membrane lipoprotein chaperone LolA [Salinisphaera sp. W335]